MLLDHVSDPHNVGAILRSAEVFGARAVIATQRHAAPETGALGKDRKRCAWNANLICGCATCQRKWPRCKRWDMSLIGLDGESDMELGAALASLPPGPSGLVLGQKGRACATRPARPVILFAGITAAAGFGSLNVSNAAAVALYAARAQHLTST